MTATLDIPVSIAISALRKAGTGENLLEALNHLVNYQGEDDVQEEIVSEPAEWVNAINLNDDEVIEETVTL